MLARPCLALLAVAACSPPPPPPIEPATVELIRREVATAMLPIARPPLGAPTGEGDAAADYSAARAGLASLPAALDDAARVRYGRFARPDDALPDAVRAAAGGPAVAALIAAVVRGAGKSHVTSPMALAYPLGGSNLALVGVAEVITIAARVTAETDPAGAAATLLALARMGQDLTRGAHLLAHAAGLTVEDRAARALLDLLASGRLGPRELAALAPAARTLMATQPTLRDALTDEARFQLALAGAASGLVPPLDWAGNKGHGGIGDLGQRFGGVVGVASRARAQLEGYRALGELPLGELTAAAEAVCARAFAADLAGCKPGPSLTHLAEGHAAIRAVAVALALADHAARTGAWPATLAELGELPRDPFTAAPLGYAVVDGRARLTAGPRDHLAVEVALTLPHGAAAPAAGPPLDQKK